MRKYDLNIIFDEISKALVGRFEFDRLKESVLDLCMHIFQAQACSLFLFDEVGRLRLEGARGYSAKFLGKGPIYDRGTPFVGKPTNDNEKIGITAWVAATGREFVSNSIEDYRNHPHWRGIFDVDQFGPNPDKTKHTIMALPLVDGNHSVIGVLKVEGKRDNRQRFSRFSSIDLEIFRILSAHIAIAFANAQAVKELNSHLLTITHALDQVIASLSEEDSLQNLFDRIITITAEVLNAEACVLFLKKDTDPEVLIERAGIGYVENLINKAEYHLIPRDQLISHPQRDQDKVGLTAYIAITGESYLARNNDELKGHPHWRGKHDKEHYPEGSGKRCNSFMGVPLKVDEKVVGVLKVENKKIRGEYVPFDEQDQELFETLVRSLSIAIDKMHKQRVKREQSTTDAMLTISQALAGKFELDKVLAQIVEVGKQILNAEACVIFLIDPNNPNRLIETKGEGYVKKLEGRAEYTLIPRDKLIGRPEDATQRVGLTAWIAITGQAFLARTNEELKAHPHWRGHYDRDHYGDVGSGKRCNSFLGLPLLVGKEVLGVLKVENKVEGGSYVAFNEREQQIFEMLANSAAIAITNAREFKRMQDLAAIGMSAAAVAHRMGTPLQTIHIITENLRTYLIAEGKDSKELERRIEEIRENVNQMGEAIRRLRKAAAELHPSIARHDLTQVLMTGALIGRLPARYAERGIQIRPHGLEQLIHHEIECDDGLLREALENLVTNSIEVVPDNGAVEVEVLEVQGRLVIDIVDDGPGLDRSKTVPFEPFKSTKRGGLGLGLFIVRRNIEAMQGTVRIVDQPAGTKGSRFRIELPIQQ